MMPMVVDVNNRESVQEMAQELMTRTFHQHLKHQRDMRQSVAVQEAQERSRAARNAERVRNTRKARFWRHIRSLVVTVGLFGILSIAYTTEQISNDLFQYAGSATLVSIGWCMNNVVRQFRRNRRVR